MATRLTNTVRARPIPVAVAISALASLAYLLWDPHPLDLAAQTFRADLWESDGWVLWSPDWYGGHTIPGYSLLYPPLAALLTPNLLGLICSLSAAALFGIAARRAYGEQAWLGTLWFGLASTVALYGGRLTFGLGIVFGLGCVLAIQSRRPVAAALAAAGSSCASPVAGLFVAIAASGVVLSALLGRLGWGGQRRLPVRASLAAAIGAMAAICLLILFFPTAGYQPFTIKAWYFIPLTVIALLVLADRSETVVRWVAAIYLLAATVALYLDTPLGGNVVRFATTFSGPVLALLLVRRRPVALALLALPLLYWQWVATIRDDLAAAGDKTTRAAYYEPLADRIEELADGRVVRVEVPPTRSRWEAVYLAERVPLARGWLRQLEADDFDLFQHQNLDPASYRDWLRRQGVSYVALPLGVDRDYLARDESELIEAGLPYLREVWSNPDWRLFMIGGAGPHPLVDGPADLLKVGPDGFTVVPTRLGRLDLRIRWTPYFQIDDGDGCIEPIGDWTRLEASSTEPIRIEAMFDLDVVTDPRRSRCSQ